MAVTSNQSLQNPCALCMGFSTHEEMRILCKTCTNWFHQKCAKLSNVQLENLTNNANSNFKCSLCKAAKTCENCGSDQLNCQNSLYCVTCLKYTCDGCNTFSSDQIHILRNTEKPYYCPTCALEYPCIICKYHCYNDTVHDPSIQCDSCCNWVHYKCSKLTANQFNKYGCIDLPYYCIPCLSGNLPFTKLSKLKFDKLLMDDSQNELNLLTSNAVSCNLCVECNLDCNACTICPNLHRVCSNCISCKYISSNTLNSLLLNTNENDVCVLHMNIRSLPLHCSDLENHIFNNFDKLPHVICITETRD